MLCKIYMMGTSICSKLYEDQNLKTCVDVADSAMGWAVEVAEKVGVPAVAVWTAPASLAALVEKIPVLIESEVMDANGWLSLHLSVCVVELITKKKILLLHIHAMHLAKKFYT